MSENANLRVVSQVTDGHDTYDIEHLQSWVKTLPANNLDQACKMLHGEMRDFCSKNLAMSNRLAALDILRLSVKKISEDFTRFLTEQGMILSEDMNALSILIQSLHSMLIDSYKRCVVSLQTVQMDTRIQIAQVIHRSVSEILSLLILKYQLYNNITSELWGDINHLYLLSEKLEVQNAAVEDEANQFVKYSSIRQLMIQTQLLALSQPYSLRRTDLALVRCSLEYWSDYVYFAQTHKEGALFQINLRSNEHAGYVTSDSKQDSIRYIDANKLVQHLSEALHYDTPTSGFILAKAMDSRLIAHLCHYWGKHLKRKFHRSQVGAPVSVGIGMLASHFHLKDQKKFAEAYKHICLEKAENKHLEMHLDSSYPAYSMSVSNIGFGGLCLVCKDDLPSCVDVGELISICFKPNTGWLLGVVRWVHIHPNQTAEIGVSILGSDFDVGFVHLSQAQETRPPLVPAIRLVTIDCGHSDRVILPSGFIEKESLIEAHFLDKKGAFYLKEYECLAKNMKFDIFHLQTPKESIGYLEMT